MEDVNGLGNLLSDPSVAAAIKRSIARSQDPFFRFGSTLAGENPDAGLSPIVQLGLHQQQMGLEREKLDLANRRETRERSVADASIAHVRQQMATGMIDFIKKIQPFTATIPPEALDTFAEFGTRLGQFAAQGSGQEGLISKDLIKTFLTQPQALDTYLKSISFVNDAQRAVLRQTGLEKGIPSMMDELMKMSTLAKEDALKSVRRKVSGLSASQSARTVTQAIQDAQLTPQERDVALEALSDPKNDPFLISNNIIPPSVGLDAMKAAATKRAGLMPDILSAEALGAGLKARETALAQEDTLGGKTKIAETQAQTTLAGAKTREANQNVELGKIVPAQPGAPVLQVKPSGVTTLVEGGKKPADATTRGQYVNLKESLNALEHVDLSVPYFGMTPGAAAKVGRAGEQLGANTANKGYEDFWANLNTIRADVIRSFEKGNISKSDMDFFLAMWPEQGVTAPTKARAGIEAVRERFRSRKVMLEQEFPDLGNKKKTLTFNPTTGKAE